MNNVEQLFLKELDDKLWKAASKPRSNLDGTNHKHASDAFEEQLSTVEKPVHV